MPGSYGPRRRAIVFVLGRALVIGQQILRPGITGYQTQAVAEAPFEAGLKRVVGGVHVGNDVAVGANGRIGPAVELGTRRRHRGAVVGKLKPHPLRQRHVEVAGSELMAPLVPHVGHLHACLRHQFVLERKTPILHVAGCPVGIRHIVRRPLRK